jgi:two-component system LytT family response regulator
MAEWKRLLPTSLFLRLDRSTIVNLAAIREFRSLENRHALVHFHGSDEPLELRRMAARRLRKALCDLASP